MTGRRSDHRNEHRNLEFMAWWREQGWTPARAHKLTRYWPEGAFLPRAVEAPSNVCEWCGDPFVRRAIAPTQRFCCEQHRRKGRRQRLAA